MAKVEFERWTALYEFEDRANFFMAEVAARSKEFPDLVVETDNETEKNLEENSDACRMSFNVKKMHKAVFDRGYENDLKSRFETVVSVSIQGNEREIIREFEKIVHDCASNYWGKIVKRDGKSHPDAPEGEHKFFTYLDYCFRG